MRDIAPQYVSNGVIGLIFSASGPIAVTLAVGAAGGLSQAELASWVFGIFLSAGLATLVMSLLYRQPLGFAWSIPGTVLLGPSLQHLTFPEVVGAFFVSGVLILALGATGLVRRIMAAIPMPIVMAMVAAVFLRFGTDIVASSQANPVVAGPMVLAFIVLTAVPALGKYLPPVLGTLVVGIIAVAVSGQFAMASGAGPSFATPVFTATRVHLGRATGTGGATGYHRPDRAERPGRGRSARRRPPSTGQRLRHRLRRVLRAQRRDSAPSRRV